MGLERIKAALSKLLVEMSKIETDNGTLEYDGELEVGTEVKIDEAPAPDGIYKTETQSITVKDGKVESIEAIEPEPQEPAEEPEPVAAEEETPAEEPQEPTEPAEPTVEERLAALEAEVADLKNKLTELLQKPAVTPIEEKFSRQTQCMSKAERIAAFAK